MTDTPDRPASPAEPPAAPPAGHYPPPPAGAAPPYAGYPPPGYGYGYGPPPAPCWPAPPWPGANWPGAPATQPHHAGHHDLLAGLVAGAAVTLLLTNETVQRGLIRTLVGAWSQVQGGIEEVKERFRDAEAELQQGGGAAEAPRPPGAV